MQQQHNFTLGFGEFYCLSQENLQFKGEYLSLQSDFFFHSTDS